MAFLTPARQTTQPQGRVEVNWSNPLTRGLLSLITVVDGRLMDIINNVQLTPAGTAYVMGGARGMGAIIGSSSSDAFSGTLPSIDLSTAVRGNIFVYGETSSSSTASKRAIVYQTSGSTVIAIEFGNGTNNYIAGLKQTNTSTFPAVNTGVFYSTDRPYFVSYGVDTSASTGALYINGVLPSTNVSAGTGSGWKGAVNGVVVGGNGASGPLNGEVWIGGLYNRALTAGEQRALAENPWQLLRPVSKRVYFTQASGLYTMSADSGTFTITGGAANLSYTPAVIYTLTANSGTFTLTGGDATLTYYQEDTNNVLTARSGEFIIGGMDAILTYTPVAGWQPVNPSSASWSRIR